MNRYVFSAAATLAIGAVSPATAADYPSMTLRLAHSFPSTTVHAKTDQWWAEEIKNRSGGKIKVNIFWAEALGKSTEILDLVSSGAVQLGATFPSYYPSRLPLSGAPNALPMIFKSNAQAQKVMTALAETKEIVEEHKKNNVRPLFYHSLNQYGTLCTKPILKVDDYRGVSIRSYGQFVPKMWGALGATSVTATTSEIYDGLHRGNLTCAYYSYDLSYAFKLFEVAKHYSTAKFGALSTYPIYINEKVWSEWPESVRELVAKVSAEAAERSVKAVAEAEAEAEAQMKKAGVVFHPFATQEELEKKVPDFINVWIETMAQQNIGDQAKIVAQNWRNLLAKQ